MSNNFVFSQFPAVVAEVLLAITITPRAAPASILSLVGEMSVVSVVGAQVIAPGISS